MLPNTFTLNVEQQDIDAAYTAWQKQGLGGGRFVYCTSCVVGQAFARQFPTEERVHCFTHLVEQTKTSGKGVSIYRPTTPADEQAYFSYTDLDARQFRSATPKTIDFTLSPIQR